MGLFTKNVKITDMFLEKAQKIIQNTQKSLDGVNARRAGLVDAMKGLKEGDAKRFDQEYSAILKSCAKQLKDVATEMESYKSMFER